MVVSTQDGAQVESTHHVSVLLEELIVRHVRELERFQIPAVAALLDHVAGLVLANGDYDGDAEGGGREGE